MFVCCVCLQCNSVEECYEKLRDDKYQLPTSPDDRPYAFAPNHTNANVSPPLRRGVSYPAPVTRTHETFRAQNSDNQIDGQWRRGSNESTPHRQAPPSPRPHRLSGSDYTGPGYSRTSPTRTTPVSGTLGVALGISLVDVCVCEFFRQCAHTHTLTHSQS